MSSNRQGGAGGAADKSGRTVDEVLDAYPGEIRGLAQRVRALIQETVPEARETVKWGNPVFEHQGTAFCYIQGHKGYLRLGFQRGAEINDPEGRLEGSGKTMRHVKLRGEQDIGPVVPKWLRQAAAMSEE